MPMSDSVRRFTNLLLGLAPIPVTTIAFGMGTSFEQATRNSLPPMPLEPAGYAFTIWSLIYLGAACYAVFQFRDDQRENDLLRRIGLWTASCFFWTCVWLVFARFNRTAATVLCIDWMLISLLVATIRTARLNRTLSRGEKYFVMLPLSLFSGWVVVAFIANTMAAARELQPALLGRPEVYLSIVWLVASIAIIIVLQRELRGDIAFTMTVIWALTAIAYANVERHLSYTLAIVAVAGSLVLAVTSWRFRNAKSHATDLQDSLST